MSDRDMVPQLRGDRQVAAGFAETEAPVPVAADAPDVVPGFVTDNVKPHSLWTDAWLEMRRRPMFWVALALVVLFIVMAIAPGLFAHQNPNAQHACDPQAVRQLPSRAHWFGTDILGCDVYSMTVYGARASILVGFIATIGVTLLGSFVGLVAGYFGGWLDAVLSRVGEIFIAIPLLLGSMVILYTFRSQPGTPLLPMISKVVLGIVVFGWPSIARLMRGSVLQVKPNEYVMAAKALGASSSRIIRSHILPNAVAPVIAVATINLGSYIALEATLSFLGIGLQSPAISWGQSISKASGMGYITAAPHMLLFPSLFLSLTVLAFIMLGEVARDALDPKQR